MNLFKIGCRVPLEGGFAYLYSLKYAQLGAEKIHPMDLPKRTRSNVPLVTFPPQNPHRWIPPDFQIISSDPDKFLISVSVSLLHNLYAFGFWITGECHNSLFKPDHNLLLFQRQSIEKNSENVSNIFEKTVSKYHLKSSKNVIKFFEKYLLQISLLLFYRG